MKKWLIKVPGSTSNMGPGFDSLGLAVNRYLTMEVTPSERWEFIYHTPGFHDIPTNEENLIYKVVEFTAKTAGKQLPLTNCRLDIHCELPLARGLGSSAAAIVAGVELASILLDLSLAKREKARIASLYEGHADNVAASVYGGFIVASHSNEETVVVPNGVPNVDMVVMIPSNQLTTSESRGMLPESLPFHDSVQASSITNVLIAALLNGDVATAGKMMSRDLFHQPYRSALVSDWESITTFAKSIGIDGVALSGAGPSLMCYMKKGLAEKAAKALQKSFPAYDCQMLEPAAHGSKVTAFERSLF